MATNVIHAEATATSSPTNPTAGFSNNYVYLLDYGSNLH